MRRTLLPFAAVCLLLGCGSQPEGGRLIVLALDGVDPDAVELLVSEGKLPNFARLKTEGASGPLRASRPMLSPILWTTVATWVSPSGTGFSASSSGLPRVGCGTSPLPAGRPGAFWEVASETGVPVGVVSRYAARPAAPGAVVSWQRTDEVKRLLRQLPVVPSFGYRSGLARQLPLLRGDAIERETAAGLRGARLPVGGGIRPDAPGVEKSQ